MKKEKTYPSSLVCFLGLCIAGLMFATGCVNPSPLDRAKFNLEAGGKIESSAQFGMGAGLSEFRANEHYRKAREQVMTLLPSEKETLIRNGLWGDALTILAVSEYRLENYQAARAARDEAFERTQHQDGSTRRLGQHDRMYLTALEGLIRASEAFKESELPEGDPEKVKELILGSNGSWFHLDKAIRLNPKRPIAYQVLIPSALSGYVTLIHITGRNPSKRAEILTPDIRTRIQGYLSALSNGLAGDHELTPRQKNGIIAYWTRITSL